MGASKVVMRHARKSYWLAQVMWMLRITLALITAMGLGVKWLCMSLRIVLYGMLVAARFVPHLWWYATTPTVIRRVAYRVGDEDVAEVAQHVEAMAAAAARHHTTDTTNAPGVSTPPAREQQRSPRGDSPRSLRRRRAEQLQQLPSPINGGGGGGAPSDESDDSDEFAGTCYDIHGSFLNLEDIDDVDVLAAYTTAELAALANSSDEGGETRDDKNQSDLDDGAENDAASHLHLPRPLRVPTSALPSPSKSKRQSMDDLEAGSGQGDVNNAPGDVPHSAAKRGLSSLLQRAIQATLRAFRGTGSASSHKNTNNRAFLDIYLPISIDQLFLARGAAGGRGGVAAAAKDAGRKYPGIILVTGGAWIIGSHFWMSLLARLFALRGFVVFTPDYRNFPQATVDGMVDDMDDAIGWVERNCERFHCDANDMTLLAQSAGAHLTMLSLLRQATILASRGNAKCTLGESCVSDSDGRKFRPRYDPSRFIKLYVGVSGFYDLATMLPHLDSRGLYRSVVFEICGGEHRLPQFSCVTRLHDLVRIITDPDSSLKRPWARNVFRFLPHRIAFVHGDADQSAPHTESIRMKEGLELLRLVSVSAAATAISSPTITRYQSRMTASFLGSVGEISAGALRGSFLPGGIADATSSVGTGAELTPVVEVVILRHGNHTDFLVEEPLCHRSSVVDFVCTRRAAVEASPASFVAPFRGVGSGGEEAEMSVPPAAMPMWMRYNRILCPF